MISIYTKKEVCEIRIFSALHFPDFPEIRKQSAVDLRILNMRKCGTTFEILKTVKPVTLTCVL